jgi:hypothetical protein
MKENRMRIIFVSLLCFGLLLPAPAVRFEGKQRAPE